MILNNLVNLRKVPLKRKSFIGAARLSNVSTETLRSFSAVHQSFQLHRRNNSGGGALIRYELERGASPNPQDLSTRHHSHWRRMLWNDRGVHLLTSPNASI